MDLTTKQAIMQFLEKVYVPRTAKSMQQLTNPLMFEDIRKKKVVVLKRYVAIHSHKQGHKGFKTRTGLLYIPPLGWNIASGYCSPCQLTWEIRSFKLIQNTHARVLTSIPPKALSFIIHVIMRVPSKACAHKRRIILHTIDNSNVA